MKKINNTDTIYFFANQKRISEEPARKLLYYKTNKATLNVLRSFVKHSGMEVSTQEIQNKLACVRVLLHSP